MEEQQSYELMAGTKARRPTPKIVEGWIRSGFGQGDGPTYKPFMYVRDIISPGLSNTVKSPVTGRIHHYITQQEYKVRLKAWNPKKQTSAAIRRFRLVDSSD